MDYTYEVVEGKKGNNAAALSWMSNFANLSLNAIMTIATFIVFGTIDCYRNHNLPLMYNRQIFTTNAMDISNMNFPSGNSSKRGLELAGDLKIVYDTEFSTYFDVGLTLCFVPFIPVLAASLEFFLWGQKEFQLNKRQNWIRWLSDSLTNPLLGTILWSCFYELDMFALLSMFALLHISTVLGLVLEMSNDPKTVANRQGVAFSPLLISGWMSVFAFTPAVVYISTASGVSQIPTTVWYAFGFYVFLLVWNSLVQVMYYAYLSMPGEGLFFKLSSGACYNYAVYEALLAVGQCVVRNIVVAILIADLVPCDRYDYPNINKYDMVT